MIGNLLSSRIINSFLKSLTQLQGGSVLLTTPDGQERCLGADAGPCVRMDVFDWKVITQLGRRGDLGLLEDYRAGRWDSDDLASLLTLALRNEQAVGTYVHGSPLVRLASRLAYLLRRNSLSGSRRNIHAHYDLGNDFYSQWLDAGMTYSGALYEQADDSLALAQDRKYQRLIERLESNSGSLLEIGCGWGGFAQSALDRGDWSITGLTLSREQYEYARLRLAGHGKAANIKLQDYRLHRGSYDRLVSIEMFEAVGEQYWPVYFRQLDAHLKRGGKALLQTITIDDARFESYRRGSDVIRSHVFPGGMLPSPQRFRQEAVRAGFRVEDEFHFAESYARTLEDWLGNFEGALGRVRALGFDQRFIRLWRFYLASCIAGFRSGRTSVMQVQLRRA